MSSLRLVTNGEWKRRVDLLEPSIAEGISRHRRQGSSPSHSIRQKIHQLRQGEEADERLQWTNEITRCVDVV